MSRYIAFIQQTLSRYNIVHYSPCHVSTAGSTSVHCTYFHVWATSIADHTLVTLGFIYIRCIRLLSIHFVVKDCRHIKAGTICTKIRNILRAL